MLIAWDGRVTSLHQAHTGMAYIVMAYVVLAYIVMAHMVMAYIVMAPGRTSDVTPPALNSAAT